MKTPLCNLLCWAADPAASLRQMRDETIGAVLAELEHAPATGIPAILAGLVEAEIVRRWRAECQPSPGAVGEGG